MAKAPTSGTRRKGKAVKKSAKPEHNQAIVEDFEREGMGVAPKE